MKKFLCFSFCPKIMSYFRTLKSNLNYIRGRFSSGWQFGGELYRVIVFHELIPNMQKNFAAGASPAP